MQTSINSFLLTIILSISSFALTSATASPTDSLRSSCSSTAYPTVCVRSLSTYARAVRRNSRQLAHTALTVSAARAREASTYVSRLSSPVNPESTRPSAAFQDCVTTMTDSANRLSQSVAEVRRLGRAGSPQFALCLSNVRTWVSAALTDQNMCLASLAQAGAAGGRAAATVRMKVEEVRKVTSNALSLVNKITA